MDLAKVKHRDLVELVKNDTFVERPYEVIMLTKDKVQIDVSTNGVHITAVISPDMITKVIPREEFERISEENEAVQVILEKHMFNEFDH